MVVNRIRLVRPCARVGASLTLAGLVLAGWCVTGSGVVATARGAAPASVGLAGESIERIGTLPRAAPALAVAVAGHHAYVAAHNRGVYVVDIADPTAPRILATAATQGAAYDMAVLGDRLYVAAWAAGLEIFDVADKAQPRRLGGVATRANAHAIAADARGEFVYVGDWSGAFEGGDPDYGLTVVDVRDPVSPTVAAQLNTPGWAADIALDGRTAYLADGPGGLRVVDVSDPRQPMELGSLATSVRAYGLDVQDQRAYIADNAGGLYIVDVRDPRRPAALGALATTGAAYDVAVHGHTAWVAEALGGGPTDGGRVTLVSVADPAKPVERAHYDLAQRAWGVALGDRGFPAYAAATGSGLVVLVGVSTEDWWQVYLPAARMP